MAEKPQSFENHTKLVPLYIGFVFPVFVANLIWTGYKLAANPSADWAIRSLLALALIVLFFYARGFALRVQDRVIRLEMRLRLRELLPTEHQSTIAEFNHKQLVAMRFASDDELPALAAQVLRDRIQDKKAIKKMIKNWQADHLRA